LSTIARIIFYQQCTIFWRLNYGVVDISIFIKKLIKDSGIKLEDLDKNEILDICANYKGEISKANYILALRTISGLYDRITEPRE
jgi:hypothetical protein